MKLILKQPSPRQREFLRADTRFVAYGGARGGGKSWSCSTVAKWWSPTPSRVPCRASRSCLRWGCAATPECSGAGEPTPEGAKVQSWQSAKEAPPDGGASLMY